MADWSIKRNWDERKALQAQITARKKALQDAIDLISDELEDKEYWEAVDKIYEKYSCVELSAKMDALEYKETRNDWFEQFVNSFGLCESKRITRKQGDVFVRYSEPAHYRQTGRGSDYYVWVDDMFIKTTVFSQHEPCYITIKKFK